MDLKESYFSTPINPCKTGTYILSKCIWQQKSMGIVGAGNTGYDKDYIFAMVETLHKEENLRKFKQDEFDCIILDEAHHSPANTYQRVMEYFKPKAFSLE